MSNENNRNLKISYKCIKANTGCHMAAYAAHTTNKNTHLLTAKNTHKKQVSHKRATFRKMEFQGKRISQDNGPKAEKDKTERAT